MVLKINPIISINQNINVTTKQYSFDLYLLYNVLIFSYYSHKKLNIWTIWLASLKVTQLLLYVCGKLIFNIRHDVPFYNFYDFKFDYLICWFLSQQNQERYNSKAVDLIISIQGQKMPVWWVTLSVMSNFKCEREKITHWTTATRHRRDVTDFYNWH